MKLLHAGDRYVGVIDGKKKRPSGGGFNVNYPAAGLFTKESTYPHSLAIASYGECWVMLV